MKKLMELYWAFFRIGSLTFGGGMAMLPMLKKKLLKNTIGPQKKASGHLRNRSVYPRYHRSQHRNLYRLSAKRNQRKYFRYVGDDHTFYCYHHSDRYNLKEFYRSSDHTPRSFGHPSCCLCADAANCIFSGKSRD